LSREKLLPAKLSREKLSLFKKRKIVARKIVAYGELSPFYNIVAMPFYNIGPP
jgi:hypothetical protein